jgi:hypothetical protein
VEDHPELKSATYKLPHYPGVIGTGARFIRHVAERLKGRAARLTVH